MGPAGRIRHLWWLFAMKRLLLCGTFTAVVAAWAAACRSETPSSDPSLPTRRASPEASAILSSGPDDATRLLPDLQVSEPHELFIQPGEDGVREIRFSTTIANLGDGPLTMVGAFDAGTGEVSTIQRISHTDGRLEEYDVGRFVYDDGHDHWHLEDFIVFELWSLAADGDVDGVLASTGKMTFCLADSHPVADPPTNAAAIAEVTSCEQDVQGISVGWEDIYLAALPGQELDIPDLPDGRYAIRSTVDPDRLLLETDDNNNSVTSIVEIAGGVISYVE